MPGEKKPLPESDRWLDVIRRMRPELMTWQIADSAVDTNGALRVLAGLIRTSIWTRLRFSLLIRKGSSKLVFENWLSRLFSRHGASTSYIREAASLIVEERIMNHILHERKVREKHPHALLPEGRIVFAKWLLRSGCPKYNWLEHEAIIFLQRLDLEETRGARLTLLLTPEWQCDPSAWIPSTHARLRSFRKSGFLTRGVNVLGHFTFRSGLQRSACLTVKSLQSAGENVSCRNLPIPDGRDSQLPAEEFLGTECHDVSILHLTPDPYYDQVYARAGLHPVEGVKRIGLYAWELPIVAPDREPVSGIQEIWTYSNFVARSLSAWKIPTHVMAPGIPAPTVVRNPRSRFGLPPDAFLFLFIFDICSTTERKNPEGVIAAHRLATRKDDRSFLVLKISHAEQMPERMARLQELAVGTNVIFITEMLSEVDNYALIQSCDCYVSLHRAEGFGFTMAEAMLLGKAVIATRYSGNLDYMNDETALLVGWKKSNVPNGCLTYPPGFEWVDPDIQHASHLMRSVLEDRELAINLGARAKADAMRLLSPERASREMTSRLHDLRF